MSTPLHALFRFVIVFRRHLWQSYARFALYDASHFYVGTDLKYTYQTFLDARLKLVYNHWNLTEPCGYDSDLT